MTRSHCEQQFTPEEMGIRGWTAYRGRTLDPGTPVDVHRNLNEQRRTGRIRWTVRQNKLVVGHCDAIALEVFSQHVNHAARLRIRGGGNREVHAWLTGWVTAPPKEDSPWYLNSSPVTYRPHTDTGFRYGDGTPYKPQGLVFFNAHGTWAHNRKAGI